MPHTKAALDSSANYGNKAPIWWPGVDEAGCGPLAGPVVAAAVLFPNNWLETGLHPGLRGLNDSKQLSVGATREIF